MRDIGKNIRLLREQKGLTQEDFAQQLFVTRQTVSNYETGRTHPDIDTLEKIAAVLGSDLNTLIYGPEIPEDRKRALKLFWGETALLAVLVLTLAILYPIAKQQQIQQYRIWPILLFRLVLRPMVCLFGGWWAMEGAGLLTRLSPVRKPWAKTVHFVLLGILAAIVLVVFGRDLVNPNLPLAVRRVLYAAQVFCYEQYMIYPVLGGLLWLFRKIY